MTESKLMKSLAVVYLPITALKPRERNARTHSTKQIGKIAASIERFGFVNPVLIDRNNGIVAGHGRVEAAKKLGWETVPTVRLEHLSDIDLSAYVLADNQLATLAGWDKEILRIDLQDLIAVNGEIDVTLTGFDMADIDLILEEGGSKDKPEKIPEISDGPSVCRPGDLWLIGDHRLYCGDATDPQSYQRLLGQQRAQMVFIDPPWNVPIKGHVSGLGKVEHREFVQASGEMSEAGFTAFLGKIFKNLADVSVDGAIHYICSDWRHMWEMLSASRSVYSAMKNLCVWMKSNGGMGSLYRSQHELVLVCKVGTAPHINNVELGAHGRSRTNVWEYAGMNSFGKGRDKHLAKHPTVKPVALVADAILDCSDRGGVIVDACAGSGTTLVAAHRTGRRGFGIELDPKYCDVILKRLREELKVEPVLAPLGETFDEVAAERSEEGLRDAA
ncbi:MAG: DNA methyltransferase [Reyranella sp.]|nr:DNA methyltransferase [Reyranella sp.]